MENVTHARPAVTQANFISSLHKLSNLSSSSVVVLLKMNERSINYCTRTSGRSRCARLHFEPRIIVRLVKCSLVQVPFRKDFVFREKKKKKINQKLKRLIFSTCGCRTIDRPAFTAGALPLRHQRIEGFFFLF